MKFMLLIMSLCWVSHAQAQVSWSDSFSDSSLQGNPTWTGDTIRFIHNAQERLQLADIDANHTHIQTTSTVSRGGSWSGWLWMDFNPSTSNFCEVTLCSDSNGNAYVLRFGGDSDDRLEFFLRSGVNRYSLFQSAPHLLNNPRLEWNVTRYPDSVWSFNVNMDSTSWTQLGTCPDSSVFPSATYQWSFYYTKTRADKFYIDDLSVSGIPFVDSIPPGLIRSEWLSRSQVLLQFDENIASYNLPIHDDRSGSWQVISLVGDQIHLERNEPHRSGPLRIWPSGIRDASGNPIDTIHLNLQTHDFRDLMCTEVLFDIEPKVYWPSKYVELLNTTSDSLDVSDWKLWIDEKEYPLIGALGEYDRLIVTEDSIPDSIQQLIIHQSFVKREGRIRVTDQWSDTIESFYYSDALHSTSWKSNGGWSVVRDESAPTCWSVEPWSSANDPNGGTPGRENQVEPIYSSSTQTVKGIARIDERYILFLERSARAVWLHASDTLELKAYFKDGSTWVLPNLSGELPVEIALCEGGMSDTSFIQIEKASEPSTLWISEVMFDPISGHAEYIEFQNTGKDPALSTDLRIAKWSAADGIDELKPLSEDAWLIMPGEVVILKGSGAIPFDDLPLSNKRSALPLELPFSLSHSDGICITKPNGTILDAVSWNEESHDMSLEETTGKSIERKSNSSSPKDWRTSSRRYTYQTPGVIPIRTGAEDALDIHLSNARCSPNGDGIEDVIVFHIPRKYDGKSAELLIRSAAGVTVGKGATAHTIDPRFPLEWGGEVDGKVLPTGQYMIELTISVEGDQKKYWRHGCLIIN